jgi:hypothetical protein
MGEAGSDCDLIWRKNSIVPEETEENHENP